MVGMYVSLLLDSHPPKTKTKPFSIDIPSWDEESDDENSGMGPPPGDIHVRGVTPNPAAPANLFRPFQELEGQSGKLELPLLRAVCSWACAEEWQKDRFGEEACASHAPGNTSI